MTFEPATPAGLAPVTIHTDTPADVIGFLPPNAADKLRALRRNVADLHLLIPDFSKRSEVNAARYGAEQRLKRLQDHQQNGGFSLPDDDPRVREARREVKRLAAEAKRINDRYEMRSQAWNTAGQVLSQVQAWLTDGKPAGVTLKDFSGPEPKPNKDESVTDAIERLRRRGRELKATAHTIQSAPFPSEGARAKARQTVEALAMRGAPSVSRLIEHDADLEFATEDQSVPTIGGSKENPVFTTAAWTQPDVLALFCWLNRDALIAKLDEEISNEADDKSALSHADRERRAAEVASDLLATEREECFWLWRAMYQKLPVAFRGDTNPVALLGLQLVSAMPDQSRGSSWQHAVDVIGLRR